MKRTAVLILSVLVPMVGLAAPTIDVGHHVLLPNTPNQIVDLYVTGVNTGPSSVTGILLNAQLGDGWTGTNPEPIFTNVDFSDWNFFPNTVIYSPSDPGFKMLLQASVAFNNSGDAFTTDGRVVRLTVDTTGISSGTYDLKLTALDPIFAGSVTEFGGFSGVPMETTIINGDVLVAVPEPSTVAMLLTGLTALGGLAYFRRRRRKTATAVAKA